MFKNTCFLMVIGFSLQAGAQNQMPQPSPLAKVSQTVGYTDITVEYSSPGVKGRKIFGGLLPFGELWRAGANRATKLTVSQDVTVANTPIPAGTYSIFLIPNKAGATFIINKDFNQGGTANYKKELDVVRVEVKTQAITNRERLAYGFSDFNDGQINLDLDWEKSRFTLPMKLNTETQVQAKIKATLEDTWQAPNAAARYLLDSKKDLDLALTAVDKSLAQKEVWNNTWTKAQILAAKGNAKEAFAWAQKTQALGEKVSKDEFFSSEDVKKALTDWKPKP
jgi:hypothetical protein